MAARSCRRTLNKAWSLDVVGFTTHDFHLANQMTLRSCPDVSSRECFSFLGAPRGPTRVSIKAPLPFPRADRVKGGACCGNGPVGLQVGAVACLWLQRRSCRGHGRQAPRQIVVLCGLRSERSFWGRGSVLRANESSVLQRLGYERVQDSW